MAKPNYQYEKRQKDLAKQRKKQEKEQEKAARKAAGKAEEPEPGAGEPVDGAVAAVEGTQDSAV